MAFGCGYQVARRFKPVREQGCLTIGLMRQPPLDHIIREFLLDCLHLTYQPIKLRGLTVRTSYQRYTVREIHERSKLVQKGVEHVRGIAGRGKARIDRQMFL